MAQDARCTAGRVRAGRVSADESEECRVKSEDDNAERCADALDGHGDLQAGA